MFETIGALITIVFWGAAIILFLGGIFLCIANLVSGSGWEKGVSIVAIIIAIFVFFMMYAWTESIAWCLLSTGLVFCLIRMPEPGEVESTPPKTKKYSASDAILEAYIEEKVIEEAVTNAIRKSKE